MQSDRQDNENDTTIRGKLARYSPSPSESCWIFKVHNQLRAVNSEAYKPKIIAIGPYHRGKDELKMMEEHKLRYLHFRLKQKNENVDKYLDAMGQLEARARKSYAETLNLNRDEMIEMMLLDGFFIVELFRKFDRRLHGILTEKNDTIFQMRWILSSLQRDLLLFENQLPFFVLLRLFDMIENPNKHRRFISLALAFFDDILPGRGLEAGYSEWDQPEKINHLLGLVHDNWLPTPATENPDGAAPENKCKRWYIQCATELEEAGITFEKKVLRQKGSLLLQESILFDIDFNSVVMQIPTLRIDDRTESFFRNLVAYEQYGRNNTRSNFVTDYLKFMDFLINSSKDVKILCNNEIIDNWLGDQEVVSTIFNKITDSVIWGNDDFHYAKIFENVNIHCSKPIYRWMAIFRRSYLSNPWTIISLLAAFVLLALTIVQTAFTIKG